RPTQGGTLCHASRERARVGIPVIRYSKHFEELAGAFERQILVNVSIEAPKRMVPPLTRLSRPGRSVVAGGASRILFLNGVIKTFL
ncbi:MAG: hypothetical protein LBS53_02405, partial [Synergistaceae bacterium]|nr:hypothetical protein [Synergistaceae bacterium]